jgi:polyhydroxyalkanoate synthesis regulator phasin
MTDNSTPELESFLDRMTETYVEAIDRQMDAQLAFMNSWSESVEDAFAEETIDEAYEGQVRAYEAWMDAAEQSFDRMGNAVEGEEVDAEEFRDIWLNAANKAFKEMMSTTAFAAATGQHVDDALDARRQLEEATEDTLHGLGFATKGDVREVGERIVELERRQHDLSKKLDRILDAVEE